MAPHRQFALAATVLAAVVLAAPHANPDPTPVVVAAPRDARVTPAARLEDRDLFDDVGDYVNGVLGSIGSGVSSFVASGVPQFFADLPIGKQAQDALDVSDEEVDATPTSVLNLPAYGNWTGQNWNVRVHGNVYKQPEVPQKKIDDLANDFLFDVDVDELAPNEQENARNLTKSIYVVQQANVEVTVNFVPDVEINPDAAGGAVAATGGAQTIKLPFKTTEQGDFDVFVTLESDGLTSGDEAEHIQMLNMYVEGTETGNATAYLVPPKGVTIISDIDDILRVTKIYKPKEGLLNSFARDFRAWENMPEIYAGWSESDPDYHFHYLTTTPEQATRTYMEFIYATYPLGSFDTRPLNFSDIDATLAIRRFLLDKIFRTFPDRSFVLVADTTNSDVMQAYPQLYKDYPGQVNCIFLRNTSATDEDDKFPYNTSGFEGIPQDAYMFFNHPDDLKGLDIKNGKCYNESVPQHVTFGYQNLPFGLDSAGEVMSPRLWTVVGAVVAAVAFVLGV